MFRQNKKSAAIGRNLIRRHRKQGDLEIQSLQTEKSKASLERRNIHQNNERNMGKKKAKRIASKYFTYS